MTNKNNPNQLSLDDFMGALEQKLNFDNRWIKLSKSLPWNEFRKIYNKKLSQKMGRQAKDARLVIGALIIKHKKSLPDEEVIPEIQESPYLQYFVGLKSFTNQPIFDPSLFVTLRKRLGTELFNEMNQLFIDQVNEIEEAEKQRIQPEKKNPTSTDSPSHKGQLIIDAVVAPQDIKYPTDLDLLNDAREHTERLIDQLWQPETDKRKPRTYRNLARKDYLLAIKKKRKSRKVL